MPQSYTNLLYHIVFGTKGREPLLGAELRPRMWSYLGGVVAEAGGIALCVGGMAEHVHILAKFRQDKALSAVMRHIKANSSRWVHRTRPDLGVFAWQSGYGAFSVSHGMVPEVRAYIENQEAHHANQPFEEEYIALLKAHGVQFDERYVWD